MERYLVKKNLCLVKEMNFRICNHGSWQLAYGWYDCWGGDLTICAPSPLEKMPGGESLVLDEMVIAILGTHYFSFYLAINVCFHRINRTTLKHSQFMLPNHLPSCPMFSFSYARTKHWDVEGYFMLWEKYEFTNTLTTPPSSNVTGMIPPF